MPDTQREARVSCAKRYMEHVAGLRSSVRISRMEADAYRDTVSSPRPPHMDGMPHAPYGTGDAMPDAVSRMIDLARSCYDAVAEFTAEAEAAHNAISAIADARYRELLTARYIALRTWERIAVDMSYGYDYVRKELHEAALDALYDTMPAEWRVRTPPEIPPQTVL